MTEDQGWMSRLFEIVRFIFSWVILTAIAVIVSGKFLAKHLKLQVRSRQQLRIPIPGILLIEATDDEVITGFAGFFATLFLLAIFSGSDARSFLLARFGVDPGGQFDALVVLSSFSTVLWSFVLYLVLRISTRLMSRFGDKDSREEYSKIIDQLNEITNQLKHFGDKDGAQPK